MAHHEPPHLNLHCLQVQLVSFFGTLTCKLFFLFSRNCLDFDLCESCEAKAGMHNPDHVFIKIRRPCTGVGYQDGIRKPLLKTIIYRSHKRSSTKLLVPILGEHGENENELNFRLERYVPIAAEKVFFILSRTNEHPLLYNMHVETKF